MKAHQPTEKTRAEVQALKSFGNTHKDISTYIGISPDCLEKHYRRELEVADVSANFKIASKLFKKAYVDEDLTAIIFWLKTRARWRTEDAKQTQENNEEVIKEMKALRAELDAKNRKDY